MNNSEKKLVHLRAAAQSQDKGTVQRKQEKQLYDYRLRQVAGEHLSCPRCGKDTMDPETVMRNAYSRHADIYICNLCGLEEALCDFVGADPKIDSWALFQEN